MSSFCVCEELDEDLVESGYTCYHCYETHKDNPSLCDCKKESNDNKK